MPESGAWRGRDGYRSFVGDVAGGTIAALIALPYGLAMARLMGLPPALGLFTSIATAPITALLGRNPVLIGGTAGATVPFLAAAVSGQGIGGAAKLCLVAAGFMILFGLLRLGRYAAKVPHTVVSGFSCGVGAMMVILQLRTLFGLPAATGGPGTNALTQLAMALAEIGATRREPLVLGLIVIGGAMVVGRIWPRSPAALVGVALAIGAANRLGWREQAVGFVSPDWPPLASFRWSAADFSTLVPSAFGLAVVASVNLLITSRVVEHFRGRHRHLKPCDADAELRAYGLANLCVGAFGAPPSVGIPARSLANVRCGGRTRLSNLLHAAALLILVRFGSGPIGLIPLAALAGVTAHVGLGLLEWSTWRRLPRMRRVDALAFLTTVVATLVTNAIIAVALGCSLYVVHHLYLKVAGPLPALHPIRPREAKS